ncbi:hypothetical protein RND71_019101 [Anisodus tanguticus]|uniref:Uncharacterized protein n=1 Tax=Anisodus tanguticus TaxID=243964 RepID=A0AAE1RWW7_9SOLA|nr:hypothetical protein RND71_019101 [Anisodus tanguticus]
MRDERKPGYGAKLRANLDPTKGVGRLRSGRGRWSWKSKSAKECVTTHTAESTSPENGWRLSARPTPGRRGKCRGPMEMSRRARRSLQNLGREPGGAAVGADLGGSSKYSNENFEGRRGERFHVNGTCTWVNDLRSMEQCRQGKSAKWIRNFGGKGLAAGGGPGVPVPNPSAVGGAPARLLPRRERRAARRPAGGTDGNGSFGGLPRASNGRLGAGTDKGNPFV